MARTSRLPSNLPPRGLCREAAAEYIGVSPRKFDELVADGRVSRPIKIDGRSIWDRKRLDQNLDALGGNAEDVDQWKDGA
jgi:hypothetical protein